MLRTLKTLFAAVNATAEERLCSENATALIDQKIREAETALRAAKEALAALIQRQRSEQNQADTLAKRIEEMTARATAALADDREDLATEAAQAIAQMENEAARRTRTLETLDHQVMRLQSSVEAGHRRLVDLRQGAIQARSLRKEQAAQAKISGALGGGTGAMEEAETLIAQALGQDDPFEQSEILREIEGDLGHSNLDDRMADEWARDQIYGGRCFEPPQDPSNQLNPGEETCLVINLITP